MSLKNYQAYNVTRNSTPKQEYYNDMTAMQELAFENAPNVFYGDSNDKLEYEYKIGSNQYKPVPIVRIDDVVSYNTGLFDDNDFKTFIFMNDFAEARNFVYGCKFRWHNNIWLVINAGTFNGIMYSVEVRRCNNVARFYDNLGNEIYEPCILDNVLRFTRNMTSAPVVVSNGEQKLWIQRNENTSFIKPNTRFLFGPTSDRKCWKVYGSGEKNYLNTDTYNDDSVSLSEIYMAHDAVDMQRDDLVKGFADARVPTYTIAGNIFSGEYQIGDIIPLELSVYKSGNITDNKIVYTIDNTSIATISDNSIIINKTGNAVITASMYGNDSVKLDMEIKVVESPVVEYSIKIVPEKKYLLQGQKQIFECGLYKNGTLDNKITDFTIRDVSVGVPSDKYLLKQINSNSFELTNKNMFMTKPVIIKCSTDGHDDEFSFELRGVY